MINKGISKAVSYTGIGSLDTTLDSFLDLLELILFQYVYSQEYILSIIR